MQIIRVPLFGGCFRQNKILTFFPWLSGGFPVAVAMPNAAPHWFPLPEHHLEVFCVGGAQLAAFLTVLLFILWMRNRRNYLARTIFRYTPTRTMVLDRQGNLLYWQAPDLQNREKPQHYSDLLIIPDAVTEFQKALDITFQTEKPQNCEYTLAGKRRRAQFVKLPKRIFRRDAVLCISTDIDELYTARSKAEAIAERFELTLNSIGDGVIVTDAAENVTLVNPVAANLTGYSSTDMVGRKLADRLRLIRYPDDAPVVSPLVQAIESGEPVQPANHTGLIAADGTRRYIANSAAPIRDRQGDITGAVMIIRDMTCENATRDWIYRQKELLENASTTIKIVYFCCSCDKERIVLSRIEYNGEIWGKDAAGKPLPEDQWISPEDYPDYQESWRKILAGEVEPAAPSPAEVQKPRVLLVDDVPMNLKVLSAMLRKLDIESVCALSGKEALAILRKNSDFKLVLTDLWMPEIDGAKLAKEIHQSPELAKLPVIAVTADAQVIGASAAEFQGVLYKPVTINSLRDFFATFPSGRPVNPIFG
ncbi:PAS domain-containing protein [Victivallis sp. Marseille-Q1083]|uniref:response regulator n=1 Tax=Victivallis sp. Marseille-Q1083 TaxID=2717288 RepID=UPI00158CA14E|nr:PAS domain-containing protein [Victivallis sp. Marseille-Q1083]